MLELLEASMGPESKQALRASRGPESVRGALRASMGPESMKTLRLSMKTLRFMRP